MKDELVSFLEAARVKEQYPLAYWVLFSVMGFYAPGCAGIADKFFEYVDSHKVFPTFKIVSFNYTDTIFEAVNWLKFARGSSVCLETKDLGENFYRIHGALDSEVIFGIDSECDIPNAFISLRKSNHISINAKQRFSDIIENSKRIIIFGHSIYMV